MTEKSILITGCSSGIGLASAILMKKRGWRVLATARSQTDIDRLKNEHGLDVLHLELADPDSISKCADAAIEMTSGRLFALFNNAAYGQTGAIEDVPAEHMRHQFEVNVIGTHDLTRRLIPAMRKNRAGRIVQCSSVLGLVSGSYRGAYSATKFALEALSDAMRMELEGSGIRVSLIEPGPIHSKFIENVLVVFDRTIDAENSPHKDVYEARRKLLRAGGSQAGRLAPEAVAEKLVHAVESANPKPRYFVTTPTYLADVMRRTMPTFMLDRMMRGK